MPPERRRYMMGRPRLTPAVAELPCPARKTRSHIGIAERENRPFLVDALRYDKLKIAVLVLRNAKVRHGAEMGVELNVINLSKLWCERRSEKRYYSNPKKYQY